MIVTLQIPDVEIEKKTPFLLPGVSRIRLKANPGMDIEGDYWYFIVKDEWIVERA